MSDFDDTTKRLAREGRDEFERAMGTYLGLKLSTDELTHVYRMVQMVACEAASEGYMAGYNRAEGIVNKSGGPDHRGR